ncbi:MAG: SH3 domain-containing protein [Chloroflexi bacterium]|nr:SH3 domain-containing protein [Chloroflexota bacterium]
MKHPVMLLLAIVLILVATSCEALSGMEASGPECTTIVKRALEATNEICDGTGRNQACYGHALVRAEPQPGVDSFRFEKVGEKVDVAALKSLHLSPMDTNTGTWGVSMMRLQANLPDTSPGENVTLLLFGDVEVRNIVPAARLLNVTTSLTGNVNVRREPADTAFVMGTLPPGTVITARGRSEDGAWLYVDLPDNRGRGWVNTSVVRPEGDIQTLNTIQPYLADAKPMQAFYLRTGNNATTCAETPNDGLVIQTPEGEAEVRLWINEVKIRLKSTVFVQARPERPMSITTLEGEVHVEALGVEQAVPVGSSVTVQLDANSSPVAPPSSPQPVPKEIIRTLPSPVLPTPIPATPTTVPPSDTPLPTPVPTDTPTDVPTLTPTLMLPPTATFTPEITAAPTETPTVAPSPTDVPTDTPTNSPPPSISPTDTEVATSSSGSFAAGPTPGHSTTPPPTSEVTPELTPTV